jgi:adenylate kinase
MKKTQPKRASKAAPSKPVTMVLIGDPAAGKATQSEFLVKRYNLYDFDMGKELNIRRSKDKALDTLLKKNTDRGRLTPTHVVQKILKTVIDSVPKSKGIMFDGHPKMLTEAKFAVKELKRIGRAEPIIIYLSIPLAETVKRMHNRQGYFAGKFGKRADDSDEALKNRARYYRVNIAAVIKFFSSKYRFKKINALGSVAEVRRRVEREVEKFLAAQ